MTQERLEAKISSLKRDVKKTQGWLTHYFVELGYTRDTSTYKAGGITQDYELLKVLNQNAAKKEAEQKQSKKWKSIDQNLASR